MTKEAGVATLTSRDGTTIGYDRQGDGPAVILIDGALSYRQFGSSLRLAELLAPRFTVLAYDRRGRGESGDTKPHSVEREIEDISALIDVVDGSASLYGMSSGACLAFEAALELGTRVEMLAMYEPPYNSEEGAEQEWAAYSSQLTALLADGRNADAVALFMRFVGTPAEMVDGMRQSPEWPKFEAVAPTLAYDKDAIGVDRKVPTARAPLLTVPALVVNGTMTLHFIADSAAVLAVAIPNGRHLELEGQRHDVDPEVLAPVLIEFFAGAGAIGGSFDH